MIAKRMLVVSRTLTLFRDLQAAAGSGCVVVHHDRIGDLDDFVELKGPFDLLVAGPVADSRAGLARLAKVRNDHPEMGLMLVFTNPPSAPLPDVVRSGAVDLVGLPADPRVLRAATKRALALECRPPPMALGVEEPSHTSLAEVLTVASPSGGCGKTFYSTNLAHYLSATTGHRVCLVDLDLQFGEVSAALRLRPRYTMTDAVTRSDTREADLEEHIEEYLLTDPAGFWVLPAPRSPAEADQISPPDVTRVISALRTHFDYVVLDTSAQLSEIVLTAMDQSTRLICMATLDLPSVRNMRVFLETLERLKVPTDSISVILNKVEPDMGIRVEEANEALHHKIVSVLPYAREVSRSINEGAPVMVSAPRSEISECLASGMHRHLGIHPADASEGATLRRLVVKPARGRRRRLLWWRSSNVTEEAS